MTIVALRGGLLSAVAVVSLVLLLAVETRTASAVPPVVDSTSCNGETTFPNEYCSFANGVAAEDIFIGPNSCNVVGACLDLGDGVRINEFGGPAQPGSCNGTEACLSLGENAVVGTGSCLGTEACEEAGDDGGEVTIGDGSCDAQAESRACLRLAFGGSADVGDGSCLGEQACWDAGVDGGEVSIGNGSCHGESNACLGLGNSDGSVQVFNGACLGETACQQAGQNGGSVVVGDDSCLSLSGQEACEESGSGTGSTSIIGIGSCHGERACFLSGGNSGNSNIGNGSCHGVSVCEENGFAGTGIIGNASCNVTSDTAEQACNNNGVQGFGRVGDRSCTGEAACLNNGDGAAGGTAFGSVADDSCNGERACLRNGQSVAGETSNGTIASNSCNGFEACLDNGDDSTASIGRFSCNTTVFTQCDSNASNIPDCMFNDEPIPEPCTPEISASLSCAPLEAPTGSDVACNIAITNENLVEVQNVALTTQTPSNTTFVAFTDPGGDWLCTTPAPGGTGPVFCDPDMAPGEVALFTFVFNIDLNAPIGAQIAVVLNVTSDTEGAAPESLTFYELITILEALDDDGDGTDGDEDAGELPPGVACCPIDLDAEVTNENTNVIGIDNDNDNDNANDNANENENENENMNENENANTNAQDQDNDQGQDNANEQINNIDASPEVKIDFGD